jgi:hypothetical protein
MAWFLKQQGKGVSSPFSKQMRNWQKLALLLFIILPYTIVVAGCGLALVGSSALRR